MAAENLQKDDLSSEEDLGRQVKPLAPGGSYHNNLLAAVGYLDLANSMDFAANVWNDPDPPVYARVLMAIGGSVIILAIGIAVWDLHRSWQNVKFLRRERCWLKEHVQRTDTAEERRVLNAWLAINRRELGWEYFDRIALDVSMALSAFLVGPGTIMAVRGDIPQVFRASNLLSGYVGNSFMPAYAIVNTAWSIYMWRCAHRHELALKEHHSLHDASTLAGLLSRIRKHQLYALLISLTMWVTAVGSMMSATMWHGYVVLIPSIVGSVIANWFWRQELGYTRTSCATWPVIEPISGILEQYQAMRIACRILSRPSDQAAALRETGDWHSVLDLPKMMKRLGLEQEFARALKASHYPPCKVLAEAPRSEEHETAVAVACMKSKGLLFFLHGQRFLEELYGHWLCALG